MNKQDDAYVLVIEHEHGVAAYAYTKKRWKILSPTLRETRIYLDGVPVWVKYQAWLEPEAVTDACQGWLKSLSGVAF